MESILAIPPHPGGDPPPSTSATRLYERYPRLQQIANMGNAATKAAWKQAGRNDAANSVSSGFVYHAGCAISASHGNPLHLK